MGVLAFLLDTKLGHMLIGLLCILIVGAGMYWRGHNKGFDAATAHYQSVVGACVSVNASQAQSIGQLKAANKAFADAAKAEDAKAAQAVAQANQAQAENAKALAAAQAKLREAEKNHGDAHAWSVTPVPPGVLDALGVRGAADSPY